MTRLPTAETESDGRWSGSRGWPMTARAAPVRKAAANPSGSDAARRMASDLVSRSSSSAIDKCRNFGI
eukprot:scaffold1918_cov227-Chaetoceros_neogracile.AAC.2